MTSGDNKVTDSELQQILAGAQKMQSDAQRKGRDDLVDKARGIVDELGPGERDTKSA
ncbi:MAG: hypothetical protein ACOH2Q_12840 [Rhodococcus sp. (in: high G+C Gram-positive bacteria)]